MRSRNLFPMMTIAASLLAAGNAALAD